MKSRRELLYIDSNILLYPIVYDAKTIKESRESRDLLLKISEGLIRACTVTIT